MTYEFPGVDSILRLKINPVRIILTAMNSSSGKGDRVASFCSGPRTGASGENVSPPTTGLQKGKKMTRLWSRLVRVDVCG